MKSLLFGVEIDLGEEPAELAGLDPDVKRRAQDIAFRWEMDWQEIWEPVFMVTGKNSDEIEVERKTYFDGLFKRAVEVAKGELTPT